MSHWNSTAPHYLETALAERMAYRGDFALGTLMRFLPLITQIFLWWAIFQSIDADQPGSGNINGYSFVIWSLLPVDYYRRAFSSMPGLSSYVATRIRDGEIKKFLVQPVRLSIVSILVESGSQAGLLHGRHPPVCVGVLLVSRFFQRAFYHTINVGGVFGFAAPQFCVRFFILRRVWAGGILDAEVSSLLFVYMLFQFFLSGHMFPLDISPAALGTDRWFIYRSKYLAYFPAAVLLGKVTGTKVYSI